MVGYYSTEISEESRVVCSPDLPITVTKLQVSSSNMTATTTTPGQPGPTTKRREPVTTMSTEETYSTDNQNKRKILTIEGMYSDNNEVSSGSQVKRLNYPLKMMPMEETYSQDVSSQNSQPGQSGSASKRKELLTAMSTEDPYQCNICSKTFAVPARLTRHYRTHTGEKPFQCEYCAKSFSVKENLSVHRRIHTKERPYKCEVCARAFEHSGKLHRHMRIHTGERPHKCGVCGKTFIQSGQLVIHTRTHTGEKPYVCSACGKGFTCSKQLKVHSRTHTGEKPYACDICGKSFGYNHVLKLHQVAHYGEKVYKCTICNDTFTSKKCMEAHIKSHSENPASPPPSAGNNSIGFPIVATSPLTSDNSNTGSVTSSDKENSSVEEVNNDEGRYYGDYIPHDHYTHQSGVDLLAAAAVATNLSTLDSTLNLTSPEEVLSLISSRKLSQTSPSIQYVQTQNNFASFTPNEESEIRKRVEAVLVSSYNQRMKPEIKDIDHGTNIRKRVEAALASTIDSPSLLVMTPPNSTSVSPASSPEPSDQRQISLPPRKRSKMILMSMQMEPNVRYSSVIQYAKAV